MRERWAAKTAVRAEVKSYVTVQGLNGISLALDRTRSMRWTCEAVNVQRHPMVSVGTYLVETWSRHRSQSATQVILFIPNVAIGDQR